MPVALDEVFGGGGIIITNKQTFTTEEGSSTQTHSS